MSKAKPEGHVICLSPARVHLQDGFGWISIDYLEFLLCLVLNCSFVCLFAVRILFLFFFWFFLVEWSIM